MNMQDKTSTYKIIRGGVKKSQSFVSVITVVNAASAEALCKLPELCSYLGERYNDYEVLVMAKKDAQSSSTKFLDSMLQKVPSIRYLQLSDNVPSGNSWYCG